MAEKRRTASERCYQALRALVRWVYPKITVEGLENLPQEPCLLVGNHAQMNGPIIGELYIPGKRAIWCTSEMMHRKEVPAYAYQDFWSKKPRYLRWFYKLLSYLIAPLSACIFNEAHTIAVYRDDRILKTFRQTLEKLEEGCRVVVFPESQEPYNHIVSRFQDGFVDVGRLYGKRTGKALPFVPMYVAPRLRKVYLGKPVFYDLQAPKDLERRRISVALMDAVTELAVQLPRHTVIPYQNIPKKDYPTNLSPRWTRSMKKPVVDYRKFRFSKLNDPQFSHLKLLAGWIFYFASYFLTENLISPERCHVIHCALDDQIPFCEYFVIPYVFWYLLIVGSLLYFLLYDVERFRDLQTYIIITQLVATIVYIVYPSRQDLRPETFASDNFCTQLVGFLYSVDTNTNVCPSLHCAYSIGIASAWLREKDVSRVVKAAIVVLAALICVSTAFIKQHSVVDFFAAIPVCLLAEYWVYGRRKAGRPQAPITFHR